VAGKRINRIKTEYKEYECDEREQVNEMMSGGRGKEV